MSIKKFQVYLKITHHNTYFKIYKFLKKKPFIYGLIEERGKKQRYLKRLKAKKEDYPKLLENEYYENFKFKMDINNPKTYTEKIQYLKLYDTKERTELADKVKVREWVSNKIGPQYLVPSLGIYNNFEEIDFEVLPTSFVIKTNHGSGWNIVVKDKNKINKKKIKRKLDKWLSRDFGLWSSYEIHYSNITPKIIIEDYLKDRKGNLVDYRFLCFNGEVKYLKLDFEEDNITKRNIYNMNWEIQPWNLRCFDNYLKEVETPQNFDEMVRIASILCKDFKHVRVDLYNVDGNIYFGEMTFTTASGFVPIVPYEYDKYLGDLIPL